MATIVVTASGGDRAWSTAATWVGGTPAGAGDTARFDVNSGNVFVDGNVADLTGLDMLGYTNALMFVGVYTLDVDGNVTLEGSTASSGNASEITISGNLTVLSGFTFVDPEDMTLTLDGTGNVTTNGVTLPKVTVVAGAGTHTLIGSFASNQLVMLTTGTFACGANGLTLAGFTLAGGTFTGSGAMAISGNLLYSSGTNNHTGTWTHAVTKTASWNTTNQQIADYRLAAGITITKTATVAVKKLVVPATSILGGNQQLWVYASGTDFLTVEGVLASVAANVVVYMQGAYANAGAIEMTGTGEFRVRGDEALYTQTGPLNVLNMSVSATTNNHVQLFRLSGAGHDIGDVLIGHDSIVRAGSFDFDNASVKVGDVIGGLASIAANVVDFGSAYIEIQNGKAIDFDDGAAGTAIGTLTADDGACHIVGIGTATVDWVIPAAATDVIHCHECVDGGNNHADRVTFDEHAHPGSLALLGVGI